jgi:hypothetical protein
MWCVCVSFRCQPPASTISAFEVFPRMNSVRNVSVHDVFHVCGACGVCV